MIDLDNIEDIKKIDKSNQFEWISSWPEMIKKGFSLGMNTKIPKEISIKIGKINLKKKFRNIGICGMGGSAISGEYIQNFLIENETGFDLPINIIRGYKLPNYLTSDSLIIVVSYSGNTRETLFCLLEAIKRNIYVIFISSGGVLIELSEKYNFPIVKLPKGYAPRAAFPLLFSALCGIFSSLFPELKYLEQELSELTELLIHKNSELNFNTPINSNPGKKFALKWLDKIPIFISQYSCLGMRMKGQMNENSKKIAFYDFFPEMMHNSVQGWKDESINNFIFVRIFFSASGSEMIDKTDFSLKIVNYHNKKTVDKIIIKESNLMKNLFVATYLVDYVSLYMSVLQNIDPSNIDIISKMKEEFDPKLNLVFNIKNELNSLLV